VRSNQIVVESNQCVIETIADWVHTLQARLMAPVRAFGWQRPVG
jgi:hypothetical protein